MREVSTGFVGAFDVRSLVMAGVSMLLALALYLTYLVYAALVHVDRVEAGVQWCRNCPGG